MVEAAATKKKLILILSGKLRYKARDGTAPTKMAMLWLKIFFGLKFSDQFDLYFPFLGLW